MKTETLEQEARRLRDIYFGKSVTDEGWKLCKDNWIKDIEFLRKHAK